jgi:hypothetical protein
MPAQYLEKVEVEEVVAQLLAHSLVGQDRLRRIG